MSKAFTSEDSGTPPPPLVTRRLQGGPRRPMTASGHAALVAERAALETEAPSEEQKRRLTTLDLILAEVVPVGPPASPLRVAFDTWVTLAGPLGAEVRYRLVGPDESDVRMQRLSVESPLARALLGKGVGEVVTVERPAGAIEYEVRAIHVE